ncbi:MAG TPA: R3H domain-containing nucleic acid-binding protein [Ktedonobacterales bacterium]|nr:R3H domain-containing nucleic acid-binding protein [Ktedonobacterales bacterium]
MHHTITDDLDALLDTLPPRIATALATHPQRGELIEIVMDLGRLPEARFPAGEVILHPDPVIEDDITYVTERVGAFGDDNRAGIERTLHRISAIRNRRGKVIGLTCRVGRAVFGTVPLIQDVVEQGRSLLILGRPGVGKTTMLREVARVLADDLGKRVVIVDTSNEIAGDGDVPHPGIGRARRMQVARVAEQHAVMIEAVENHMPEVIIIDEIGTELEAQAARTIAERGVQLVGTAHGNTLDNLLLNPTLSDLVGGISAVTLGDEEARRRGTQKTVLERKAPPTFDVVVEQQDRLRVLLHADVATSVDALLRGERPSAELRSLGDGQLRRTLVAVESQRPELAAQSASFGREDGGRGRRRDRADWVPPRIDGHITAIRSELPPVVPNGRLIMLPATGTGSSGATGVEEKAGEALTPLVTPKQADGVLRIFVAGLNRERVQSVAREFGASISLVNSKEESDVVLMLRSRYQKIQGTSLDVPIVAVASRGTMHLRKAFAHILGEPLAMDEDEDDDGDRPAPRRSLQGNGNEVARALQEAEDAIHHILRGNGRGVELSPQRAPIRRRQHLLAERYNVRSRSQGQEPNRRVCIFAS